MMKNKKMYVFFMSTAVFFMGAIFLFGASVPNAVAAGNCGCTSSATSFCNPLQFCSVEEFLTNALVVIRQIIVLLSLIFIVIGALIYITSAGESGRIETAKKAISAAMIGLAIGIAAPSFLKEIGGILGWTNVNNAEVAGAKSLSDIAMSTLSFLLSILGVIAMVMLIIGAMMYLTSAGDEDRIDVGKKIFKYSIFGIIIAMSSLILVKQIAAFLV